LETSVCPPHYWEITSEEVDRVIYDHHRCVRCGIVKDTVRAPLTVHNSWRKAPRAAG
jgi:ferredoxin-like protein FixX